MAGSTTKSPKHSRSTREAHRAKVDAKVDGLLDSFAKFLKSIPVETRATPDRRFRTLDDSMKHLDDDITSFRRSVEQDNESRRHRRTTCRTELSDPENSSGALAKQAPSDREVERTAHAELFEPKVEPIQSCQENPTPPVPTEPQELESSPTSGARTEIDSAAAVEPVSEPKGSRPEQIEPDIETAQRCPETPSPIAPSEPTKLGTTLKSGARARFVDAAVAEPESQLSDKMTRSCAREGIGTRPHVASPDVDELLLVDPHVACSEMSRDSKYTTIAPDDVPDAASIELDAQCVERHAHAPRASTPSGSAGSTPLNANRHLDLHTGSHRPRATAFQPGSHFPTEVRAALCLWTAEPFAVQLKDRPVSTDRHLAVGNPSDDLAPRGTRPPDPYSPILSLRPRASHLDSGGSPLESHDSGDTRRGSGDTQPSRTIQDSHDPRASPAPGNQAARTTGNAERGECEEIRKRKEGEGCGASLKDEQRDSINAGTPLVDVSHSPPPPSPMPTLAHVSTTTQVVVCIAGQEGGTVVLRHDLTVVPIGLQGSTIAIWDDLAVVPYIPRGDTADAPQYTSDVPHPAFTSCRVARSRIEGTPILDVPNSPPVLSLVPKPVCTSTNEKSVVRTTGHRDGLYALRDDLRVVPSFSRGSMPVIRDDLAVVPASPQGDTVDTQNCSSKVTGVSTNTPGAAATDGMSVVRTGGHDDRARAIRDDLAVVPFTSQGDTADAAQSTPDVFHPIFASRRVASMPNCSLDVQATDQQQDLMLEGTSILDVPNSPPVLSLVPKPVRTSTNEKFVERATGHGDGMYALRDDLRVVPSASQDSMPVIWDDREVVPSTSQCNALDLQYRMSDVYLETVTIHSVAASELEDTPMRDVSNSPHALLTAPWCTNDCEVVSAVPPSDAADVPCRTSDVPCSSTSSGNIVEGTPLRDVPTSPTPASAHAELIGSSVGHDDRTKKIRDDLMVVLSDFQGNTFVIRDDLAVVPSVLQGDMTDEQHCSSNMSQSSVHTTGASGKKFWAHCTHSQQCSQYRHSEPV